MSFDNNNKLYVKYNFVLNVYNVRFHILSSKPRGPKMKFHSLKNIGASTKRLSNTQRFTWAAILSTETIGEGMPIVNELPDIDYGIIHKEYEIVDDIPLQICVVIYIVFRRTVKAARVKKIHPNFIAAQPVLSLNQQVVAKELSNFYNSEACIEGPWTLGNVPDIIRKLWHPLQGSIEKRTDISAIEYENIRDINYLKTLIDEGVDTVELYDICPGLTRRWETFINLYIKKKRTGKTRK